jgi:adenosylcobyric acid synthase
MSDEPAVLEICVVRLPRIANFDDFEPLAREPGVRVRFTHRAADLHRADLIVLPGSKGTVADLEWLRATGLADVVVDHAARGRPLLGICGGYQMLGRTLHDPDRVESPVTTASGLGLLAVTTTFAKPKTTVRVRARVASMVGPFAEAAGEEISAYEIHVGTSAVGAETPAFAVIERGGRQADDRDGAMRADGVVVGTYLHGLFANDALRGALLRYLARRTGVPPDPRWGGPQNLAERYDRLADAVAAAVDVAAIAKLCRI